MTEQDLIKFKELSMQDGRLNLQWFAEYVAEAEREACARLVEDWNSDGPDPRKVAEAIRARVES